MRFYAHNFRMRQGFTTNIIGCCWFLVFSSFSYFQLLDISKLKIKNHSFILCDGLGRGVQQFADVNVAKCQLRHVDRNELTNEPLPFAIDALKFVPRRYFSHHANQIHKTHCLQSEASHLNTNCPTSCLSSSPLA